MAAHIGQPAPSRRFIKVYLGIWGLLAVSAVGYLAMLTFPPQAGWSPQAAVAPSDDGAGESKAIAEVHGKLSEIRKDVTQLKTEVGERAAAEKVVKTRLTALEERVSTIDGAQADPAAADGGAPGKAAAKPTDPPAADAPGKAEAETKTPPAAKPPFVPIETGSIAPKVIVKESPPKDKENAREDIVFGDAVVTRASQEFAVQLAAGSSIDVLRQSWGQLAERHAGALGKLQPRIVTPRAEGGIYRLVAGPLRTKAAAEQICAELRVGPKACFATQYAGTPL